MNIKYSGKIDFPGKKKSDNEVKGKFLLTANPVLSDTIRPSSTHNSIQMSLWHEIEVELDELIRNLEQAYSQWQTALSVGVNPAQSNAAWHSHLSHFRSEIVTINTRIKDYNRKVSFRKYKKPLFAADVIITKLARQTG